MNLKFILISLLFVSCAEIKENAKPAAVANEPAPTQFEEEQANDSDLEAEVEQNSENTSSLEQGGELSVMQNSNPPPVVTLVGSSQPGIYDLKFENLKSGQVVTLFNNDQILYHGSDLLNENIKLNSGEKYKLQFRDMAYKELATYEGIVPMDYVFDSVHTLKKDESFEGNRIFMMKDAKIYLQSHRMILKSKELFLDHSQIYSYGENNRRDPNTSGEKAGTIEIYTEDAHGKVYFGMFGQDGGHGSNGVPHSGPARSGQKGESGTSYISIGGGPDGIGDKEMVCTKQPTNGGNGENASPGRDGQGGGNGGNSGSFKLYIQNENNLDISFNIREGRKGIGGAGSAAQIPGEGGSAGDRDPNGICSPAQNGSRGVTAPHGRRGPDGVDGSLDISCIALQGGPCLAVAR